MRIASRLQALLVVAALPLAGSAALHRGDARNAEQLLTAAGFRLEPANTPEKLAYCKCLYAGGPEQYSRYQQLARIEEPRYQAETNRGTWDTGWR